jgi:hypothetical protein
VQVRSPERAPPSLAPPVIPPPAIPPPVIPPPVIARPERRFDLAIGGGVRAGAIPSPSALFDVTGRVEIDPRWSVMFGVAATAPAVVDSSNPSGRTAFTWSAGGHLGACPARFAYLELCGVVAGGALVGEGGGVLVGRRAAAPYLATGARARANLPLGSHWEMVGWLQGAPYVLRPSLVYDHGGGTQEIEQASVGYVELGLAFGLRTAR